MKYFFIIKDEYKHEASSIHKDKYGCFLYSKEEDIKHIIQTNQLHKFRKVLAFGEGSLVRLVKYNDPNKLPDGWIEDMRHFMGAKVRISWFDSYDFGFEDDDCWSFTIDNIDTVLEE